MGLCIVVPVYNVENFLRQCLESLINQNRKPDEIILVDDGSMDHSSDICDEYAAENDFVRVVHKQNAGLGFARNTGIEACTQDYITFFDSDDFADTDYVESLMKPIDDGFDTCKSTFRRVDMLGNRIKEDNVASGAFVGEEVKTALLPRLIGSSPEANDSIPMSSCCTIYSMKIIRDNHLRFVSEREWISEDIIFNIEYYSFAKKVMLTDYIGYNYRVNTGSLTTRYLPDRFLKCKRLYEKETDILNEKKLYHFCKHRLDRQFFIYLTMCFEQLNKKVSKLPSSEIRAGFREICRDKTVRTVTKAYPKKKLGVKQSAFLYLIEYNQPMLLCFIYKVLNCID